MALNDRLKKRDISANEVANVHKLAESSNFGKNGTSHDKKEFYKKKVVSKMVRLTPMEAYNMDKFIGEKREDNIIYTHRDIMIKGFEALTGIDLTDFNDEVPDSELQDFLIKKYKIKK